jgi:pimeloyl-ACP methyl ester carboxylesterase
VRELHTLLANAGLSGPFVLAGYGFGGLNVRLHASEYPADVAGLVLVNPFEEDSFLQYISQLSQEQLAGYVKLTTGMGEGIDPVASALQVVAAPPPRTMPGVIISPRKGIPADARIYLLALAKRLPGSQIVYADDSGQYVHLDQPDVAIGAIRQVVSAVRSSRPAVS